MWKRAGIVAEVGLVLGLFLIMRVALRDTLFATWQESAFGAAILSSSLLFFALPLAVMLVTGRHRRAFGLTVNDLRYHMSMVGGRKRRVSGVRSTSSIAIAKVETSIIRSSTSE